MRMTIFMRNRFAGSTKNSQTVCLEPATIDQKDSTNV